MIAIGTRVRYFEAGREYYGTVYATSGAYIMVRFGPGRTHTHVVRASEATAA